MRTTWSFHSAGQLLFGEGAVATVGSACLRRGWRRALVVTDPLLIRAGLLDAVQRPLHAAGVAVDVFSGGEPEPSVEAALRAVAQAGECQPEVIVGLGGGSNMDLAKITAAVHAHGGSPHDYFGWDRVPGPVTPLICVPTTAGTGSEVSHAAVLTDTAAHLKVSTLSQYLRPTLAVVDPELTLSCPPKVTADSGIDALTHAIEAYLATDYRDLPLAPGETAAYEGSFPLGAALAERAIQWVGEHLETAVREPAQRAARHGMALAATTAGLAFSNCAVALVHALEYPLGGVLHCSHGAGNGLLLPHVLRFLLPVRRAELARVAALLGEDVARLDLNAAAERAITAVERLQRAIGIPTRIRDLGGTREQLPGFADKAFAIKRLMMMTPRPPTRDDLLQILESAF
ncbi:MAG: iron-containing alcohol dehydrogenase [Pirellulales bacterium]